MISNEMMIDDDPIYPLISDKYRSMIDIIDKWW
jgi:hypothetical protein